MGDFMDKAKDMGQQHSDKLDQGMDKAGDQAKEKFGHEDKVDQAMEKGKGMYGGGEEPGQQDQNQQGDQPQ